MQVGRTYGNHGNWHVPSRYGSLSAECNIKIKMVYFEELPGPTCANCLRKLGKLSPVIRKQDPMPEPKPPYPYVIYQTSDRSRRLVRVADDRVIGEYQTGQSAMGEPRWKTLSVSGTNELYKQAFMRFLQEQDNNESV